MPMVGFSRPSTSATAPGSRRGSRWRWPPACASSRPPEKAADYEDLLGYVDYLATDFSSLSSSGFDLSTILSDLGSTLDLSNLSGDLSTVLSDLTGLF